MRSTSMNMNVPPSSGWMRSQLGSCDLDVLGRGSSGVDAWWSKHITPVDINIGGCGCGGGYDWFGCGGGWNGGLRNFADIIENRGEVSFFDALGAGLKEQAYTNPLGMLAIGFGLLGNAAKATPQVAGGLSSIFNNLGNA